MELMKESFYHVVGVDELTRKEHSHPDTYELIQILNGEGEFIIDPKAYHFRTGNVLLIDDRLEHHVEGGKLGVLLAVGDVLASAHCHGKLGAVHRELVFAAVGGDTDVIGLADGQRASSDDIGLDGPFMTDLCNGLSAGGHSQHAKQKKEVSCKM